ncbi:MAG: hypothetical protein A2284_09220 [Deltaproteobacteria bacterium RIFOXYA12_FULL_61_11]|nr:MAG: hypothetical protein A2284_09220 [Deltaproteobacteria bacterium RIFOXYA12_FULL_61_11]
MLGRALSPPLEKGKAFEGVQGMNTMGKLVLVLLLGAFLGCVDDGNDEQVGAPLTPVDQQPVQQPVDPGQQVPVLDTDWFQGNNHAQTTVNIDDVPDHLLQRAGAGGIINQLNSYQDLFQFHVGEGDANLSSWTEAERIPLNLALNFDQRYHLGEYNLMVAEPSTHPIIATIEPVVGGKPFLSYNLTQNGFSTSTREETAGVDPRYQARFDLPAGVTDPLAVLLFVCLDANENGRCSDERVMNLNFYINQIDPTIKNEAEVQQALDTVITTANKTYFLQAGEAPGTVYYAFRAILDPARKSLLSYKDFFATKGMALPSNHKPALPGVKFFTLAPEGGEEVDGAVEEALDFVDEMLRSEEAQFAGGSEMAQVGAEAEPIDIDLPVIQYQQALSSTLGDDFAEAAYDAEAVAAALAADPLLSDEDSQFFAAFQAEALVAAEGVASCLEICRCMPDGTVDCATHDMTPAGLYDKVSICKPCRCDAGETGPVLNCGENGTEMMAYTPPVLPEPTSERLCGQACICMPDGEVVCGKTPAGHYNKTARCLAETSPTCTCDSAGYEDAVTCPDVKAYEIAKPPTTTNPAAHCSTACLCAPDGTVVCARPPSGFVDKTTACKTNCNCVAPGSDDAIACSPDPYAFEVIIPEGPIENVPGTVIHCSQVCTCRVDGTKVCVPVVGKESLIVKCDSDCACKAPGKSGLECDRDPRVNGCFTEGTMILVGPDSYKPVEQLTTRDTVQDKQGRTRAISRIVDGPEKYRVVVLTTVAGQTLGVSETHPVMTRAGLKMARELTVLDSLLRTDGTYVELAGIERQVPTGHVYNFVLAGEGEEVMDHLIVANGLVTGDLTVQHRLEQGKAVAAGR